MKYYGLLQRIVTCLCEQLESEDRAVECECVVLPGQAPFALALGDNAWARLSMAQPSTGIGVPSLNPGNCGSELGVTIEVGVMRCFPDDGEELDVDEVNQSAMVQLQDMQSIRTAIMCCDALRSKDFILGTYTPFGPAGGAVGGFWSMQWLGWLD